MPLTPPPEAQYTSRELAFQAVLTHARHHGYAVFKHSTKPERLVIACDRAGKYDPRGKDPEVHKSRQRKDTGTKKCGCLMRVEARRDPTNQWIVRVLEGAHNHGPSAAPSAHAAHRRAAITPGIHAEIGILSQAGLLPTQVLSVLRTRQPEIPIIQKDISNLIQKERIIELNGRTPIQWLIEVIEPPYFDYFTNI